MSLNCFLVGGAVRDAQLGLVPKDKDYVVVGSSPEEMVSLGYSQVGKDFPVFHHPKTHEEYALARVERQTGQGHTAFSFQTREVTLQEDLARRDLTINSMASNLTTGELVDPFGGLVDLHSRVLRHTSPAFSEDPLRILRVARFLARFGPTWTVAVSTEALIEEMVQSGALNHLPFERVWKELERGLMEPFPAEMLKALQRWEVLDLSKGMDRISAVRTGYVESFKDVDASHPVAVRFAAAFHVKTTLAASALPREVQEVVDLVQRAELWGIWLFNALPPEAKVSILDALDVSRRPDRVALVMAALNLLEPLDESGIKAATAAYLGVDRQALAKEGGKGPAIKARIHAAQVAAVSSL